MTLNGFLQIALYFVVLIALAKPLGSYMARVYEGKPIFLARVLGPVERLIYRVAACGPRRRCAGPPMRRPCCSSARPAVLVLYALQRLQGVLPLNPQGFGAVAPDLSFNTAVSFATNTNWQNYGGETTMSYLTQMLG